MKCTNCGGTKFFEGPSGGVSVNVLCANPKCRHWFNMGPIGLEDLNRVEPTPEEKEQKEKEQKLNRNAHNLALYNEGANHYKCGGTAYSVREEHTAWNESRENVIRLTGYIDAMRDDLSKKGKCQCEK